MSPKNIDKKKIPSYANKTMKKKMKQKKITLCYKHFLGRTTILCQHINKFSNPETCKKVEEKKKKRERKKRVYGEINQVSFVCRNHQKANAPSQMHIIKQGVQVVNKGRNIHNSW
jgi:hypothetical protein